MLVDHATNTPPLQLGPWRDKNTSSLLVCRTCAHCAVAKKSAHTHEPQANAHTTHITFTYTHTSLQEDVTGTHTYNVALQITSLHGTPHSLFCFGSAHNTNNYTRTNTTTRTAVGHDLPTIVRKPGCRDPTHTITSHTPVSSPYQVRQTKLAGRTGLKSQCSP